MSWSKVDLHIHTSASDGTWIAEEVVEKVKKAGIDFFSITDHNSIENIEKVRSIANGAELAFITGVEIDTTYNKGNYHILGYGIDIKNKELLNLLSENKALMDEKDNDSIKFLENKGLKVSIDEYKKYENDTRRGGWKALNYLIDKGVCYDVKSFFRLFDGWGNPFSKMNFPSPKEVIDTIKAAGGIAVLAHPGAPFYSAAYDILLQHMLKEGIMGIECYHPENNSEVTQFCLEFCKKNRLFITGGSDCHGQFFPHRKLGTPNVLYEDIRLEIDF